MKAVARTANGAPRLKRRTQLTRRRIAGDGVEVGDAVEQAASADEGVDLLALRICSREYRPDPRRLVQAGWSRR